MKRGIQESCIQFQSHKLQQVSMKVTNKPYSTTKTFTVYERLVRLKYLLLRGRLFARTHGIGWVKTRLHWIMYFSLRQKRVGCFEPSSYLKGEKISLLESKILANLNILKSKILQFYNPILLKLVQNVWDCSQVYKNPLGPIHLSIQTKYACDCMYVLYWLQIFYISSEYIIYSYDKIQMCVTFCLVCMLVTSDSNFHFNSNICILSCPNNTLCKLILLLMLLLLILASDSFILR